MGRKSSEKKKRKNSKPVKQKPQKHSGKEQKPIKEKDIKMPVFTLAENKTEEPKQEKPKIKIQPHKIFGWLLALIMLTILVVVAGMLYTQAFKATSIAKYLPSDRTAAFVELNINKEHTQFTKTEKLLAKTEYSFEKIKSIISDKLGINLDKTELLWLGRSLGIAEILTQKESQSLSTVYFLEIMSKEDAMKFLEVLAETNFSKFTQVDSKESVIYSFKLRYKGEDRTQDKMYYIGFIENYLVVSEDKEVLNSILQEISSKKEKISDTKKYSAISANMPVNSEGFIYVNFKNSKDLLLRKYGMGSFSPVMSSTVHPFSEFFGAEGAVLIAKDDSFQVQSFLQIDGDFLKGTGDVMYKGKYSADLMKYIPDNIYALFGGENMEKQIRRLSNILSFGQGSDDFVFKNAFNSLVQKYFGNNISLEEDLLPLIENEFAVGVRKANDKDRYLIVLKLPDTGEGEMKIEKLANNFISYGTVFEPKVEEVTLPDGTVGKEIVAKSESLIKSKSKYGSYDISELKTEKGDFGIYYISQGDTGLIATDRQLLIDSLKLLSGESKTSFASSKSYDIHIKPVLEKSDELSYFDISKSMPGIKLVKSLSTGREYSANGIMAYYYIYVQ